MKKDFCYVLAAMGVMIIMFIAGAFTMLYFALQTYRPGI